MSAQVTVTPVKPNKARSKAGGEVRVGKPGYDLLVLLTRRGRASVRRVKSRCFRDPDAPHETLRSLVRRVNERLEILCVPERVHFDAGDLVLL